MEYLTPAGFIALPFVGGFAGNMATSTNTNMKEWYMKLKKSPLNPPKWVFGPAWSLLYSAMGYASYLIYKEGGGWNETTSLPLTLYGTQLALNWAWSPLFFGAHKTGLALVDMVGMWVAIGGCVYTFHPISPKASQLMLPYLLWVTFAGHLNFYVWRNNPSSNGVTITEIKEE